MSGKAPSDSPPPGEAQSDSPPPVRAAGGAVWRHTGGGELQVVLVHRAHYDDWTLPKGKVDPGETDEEAALREVKEEASIDVGLGTELETVRYTDRLGRPKVVRYWAMSVIGGEARGDHEVDRADWLSVSDARQRVTYPRDRVVLDHLADLDKKGALG